MSAPIRVAYLPLSDRPGGAERQMLALAERLPRDRFAPELIVRSVGGPYVDRATRAGIRVRAFGPADPPAGDASGGLRSRAATAARLVRTVRSARCDIIDAWLYPADAVMALARPLMRWPLVISGRRNLDPHDRFGPLERLVEAAANRLTDTTVANSTAAADHAIATQGVDPARIRVIRNGVDIPEPVSADERAALRRGLGAAVDAVIVGCVANYTPTKRLDLLVAAFGTVARDVPNARLELVGEGPGRDALEAQVRSLGLEGRVCLHGFEPAPEGLYPAFDVVALSSDREGLPNALLEAGAAGAAILTTAAGGATEIAIDGETGLVVPTADVDALAGALGRLVGDAQLRARLGAAVRPHVARTFGMARFVAEFAALYEERVEARRRGRPPAGAAGT